MKAREQRSPREDQVDGRGYNSYPYASEPRERKGPFQSKPSIANSEARSHLLDDKIVELEKRGMSRERGESRNRLGRDRERISPRNLSMRNNTRKMSDTRNHLYDSMMHAEGEQFVVNNNIDDPNITVELE